MINCKRQPLVTEAQLVECDKCNMISKKKLWCGKHGFFVRKQEQRRTIQPSKNIITPPTLKDMAKHFTAAMGRWAKKGFKTVDKTEYIKRRQICTECTPSGRCPHCGCNLWAKVALVTENCPENKWGYGVKNG